MSSVVSATEQCTFPYKGSQFTGLYSLPGSQSRAVQVALGAFGRTLNDIIERTHAVWQRHAGSNHSRTVQGDRIRAALGEIQKSISENLIPPAQVTAKVFLDGTQAQLKDYLPLAIGLGGVIQSYFAPENEAHFRPFKPGRLDEAVYAREVVMPMLALAHRAVGIQCISSSAGGQEEGRLPDLKTINCAQYALLHVRDPIVEKPLFSIFSTVAVAVNYIQRRYTLVQDGSPELGDLVVYFAMEDGAYQPQHCGVWTEDGAVISKFGVLSQNIYRHSLFDVERHYGQHVVFFRKKELQNSSAQA